MQRRLHGVFQRERLRYDPTFALEASYCHERGIPWEEYLERWSAQSRSVVVAVQMEKAERCPSCNTSPREWEEDPSAYVAAQKICHGCAAKDVFRENLPKDHQTPGSSVNLVPGDRAEKMAAAPAMRPRSARERSKQK